MNSRLVASMAVVVSLFGIRDVQAQVNVRAPFVRVQVGDGYPGGVRVRAPFVRIDRPAPGPVVVAPFVPSGPAYYVDPHPVPHAPIVRPDPAPAEIYPADPVPYAPPVPTVAQFMQAFRPHAGAFEAVVLHPYTHQPVHLAFTLPPGRPKVNVDKDEVEFEYDDYEVELRFKKDGRVEVKYDD